MADYYLIQDKKNREIAQKKQSNTLLNSFMVAPAGIEPATRGFSVLCSTN